MVRVLREEKQNTPLGGGGGLLLMVPAHQIWENKTNLPEKDVAVCAEVQRVAVLLPARVTAAQLEVHLLPLQVTLVAHHQPLPDLRRGNANPTVRDADAFARLPVRAGGLHRPVCR